VADRGSDMWEGALCPDLWHREPTSEAKLKLDIEIMSFFVAIIAIFNPNFADIHEHKNFERI